MKRFRITAGQSMVFLVLLMFIILAFAGLTVDTGQAYAQQRTLQAGANAAAISGMNTVSQNQTDQQVLVSIQNTLGLNKIQNLQRVDATAFPAEPEADKTYFSAEYLNAQGLFIANVGSNPNVQAYTLNPSFIRVRTAVDVTTYFARVAGVPTMPARALGIAGRGRCVNGIYPITFHERFIREQQAGTDPSGNPIPYRPAPNKLPNPYATIAEIRAMHTAAKPYIFRMDRKQNHDPYSGNSGNFLWVRWNGNEGSGSANGLRDSLTVPGNADEFAESSVHTPSQPRNGVLEVGDWLRGDSGNVNAAEDSLIPLRDNPEILILPLHNETAGNGNNSGFHVSQMVKVRLIGWSFNGNDGYFEFALVDDNAWCSTLTAIPGPVTVEPGFRMDVQELLVWKRTFPNLTDVSYDLVIVHDYSSAMRQCWNAETGSGSSPRTNCNDNPRDTNRRFDSTIPGIRSLVKTMFDRNNATGAAKTNNRVAYVRFGLKDKLAETTLGFNSTQADWNTKIGAVVDGLNKPTEITNNGSNFESATALYHGLNLANGLVGSPRTTDPTGKPVITMVVIITGGMANVKADGSLNNSGGCSMYSALSNYECPSLTTSPIGVSIAQADEIRAKGVLVYGFLLANATLSPNAVTIKFDRIAANGVRSADSGAAFSTQVTQWLNSLTTFCGTESPRAAFEASYTIKKNNATVATGQVNNQGKIDIDLPAGEGYSVSVWHNGVVSTRFPGQSAYNYTRMSIAGTTGTSTQYAFDMPEQGYSAPDVDLLISNMPAGCP